VNVPASFWFWPWFGYMCMVLGENGFSLVEWWCWLLFFFLLKIYMYLFIYFATRLTNGFLLTSYLVAAAILQCLWSISLAFVDIYALLVKRSLRNARAVCIFTIGDGVSHVFSVYPVKYLSIFGECWNGVDISTKKRRDGHVTLVSLPVKKTILFVNCIVNNCLYLFVDHRYTNLGCGMCISRNNCSHW